MKKSVEFNTTLQGERWIFSRVGIREKIEISTGEFNTKNRTPGGLCGNSAGTLRRVFPLQKQRKNQPKHHPHIYTGSTTEIFKLS